jgi:hypothetical protein
MRGNYSLSSGHRFIFLYRAASWTILNHHSRCSVLLKSQGALLSLVNNYSNNRWKYLLRNMKLINIKRGGENMSFKFTKTGFVFKYVTYIELKECLVQEEMIV